MIKKRWNANWRFQENKEFFDASGSDKGENVTLPHDAMILQRRGKNNIIDTGYFPGGSYLYTKKYFADPKDRGKEIILEFEGVSQNAFVYVNEEFAGKCPNGYTNFFIRIDELLNFGEENEIRVTAKTGMQQTSRWYCGSGIYRNVNLYVGNPIHIAQDGIKVKCGSVSTEDALVEVRTALIYRGIGRKKVWIQTKILDENGDCVAKDSAPVTVNSNKEVIVRQKMLVESPALWGIDTPYLYTAKCDLYGCDSIGSSSDNTCIDTAADTFGIRTLSLDHKHGLRLNGETIKLRGACIHHDSGIIGAATFREAEERRAAKLKEAGFNAIRSAHNPLSKEMLEACDRLGILVLDEGFDAWNTPKKAHDYSLYFEEYWRNDIKAMVDKDYNHPCVFAYNIGNEIPETGTKSGAALNREIAEYTRSLDDGRFVGNAVNGMFSVMSRMSEIINDILEKEAAAKKSNNRKAEPDMPQDSDVNNLMTIFDTHLGDIMQHEIVGKAIEEVFAGVDICGYNYMDARYEADGINYPNRVIVGSETNALHIVENWELVEKFPYVIGDFCWTGWDYIGEPGVGKNDYTMDYSTGIHAPYPWFLAYCGDYDICGNRRPQSYYREIEWKHRTKPYIAVCRPQHYGQKALTSNWTWSDSIESWTWEGFEGKPVQVEVYGDADESAIYLNGKLLERKPVGETMRNKAVFDTVYEPGVLKAVVYKNGVETGSAELRSAGKASRLKLWAEKQYGGKAKAEPAEIIFIHIDTVDNEGRLNTSVNPKVRLTVDGSGVRLGFGSADPRSLENFFDNERTAFDGKLLAVVRRTKGNGDIVITADAEGFESQRITIAVNSKK